MLHVSEDDVKRLLPVSKAMELVREAYMMLARAEATNPPRVMLSVPMGASMYFMPAYLRDRSTVTVKAARVNPENSMAGLPTALLTLYMYDAYTGRQVAEVEGEWLTAIRTAASSAVATDLLARGDVKVLGVYGSGTQASTHVDALRRVRDFDNVIVYSRNPRKRNAFAEKMFSESKVPISASDSPDRVAKESDVIVTATTSATPVFDGNLVKSGTYVNAIGGAAPETREVDTHLVKRSRVVVDSRYQALATYGDILTPIQEGAIRESEILELGDLLNEKSKLAAGAGDVTLFKAGGLAVLDAMVADYVVNSMSRDKARNQ